MSTAVRQRATKSKDSPPVSSSHLETPYGAEGSLMSKTHPYAATSKQQILANLISRKNAIYYIPILLFFFVVGPTAIRVPSVLYIWASHGFVMEHLLGAGVKDLVGHMVHDPHQLMVGDVTPPTPLAAYKDVILEEYLEYRKKHDIPILSKLDPEEQGPLDTKGVWKTLFLKAMNRWTCAAPEFPKTLEAVRNSGLTAYSIMFSRMAPGQRIEPHTGFSKFIQVYHLALQVPPTGPRPWLEVQECDDEEETINCRKDHYEWKEGTEFIFDDSFTHWTHNPNEEERIVLFCHIKRVDYKGWRENLIASVVAYIFSWVPFESVLVLVRGTEKTCQAGIGGASLTDAQ